MNESPQRLTRLGRKDRLIELIGLLRDGALHRAQDLAKQLGVSQRTLYRDMDTLMLSGVPVRGERGSGYQMTAPVTLPPLNLTLAELETLHLGLAVMTEADDPDLQSTARSLAAKIEAALPEGQLPENTVWGLAIYPFADTTAGIHHIPIIRAAIRNRQSLKLIYRELDGSIFESMVEPRQLDYWGRIWTCTLWCNRNETLREIRVDRVEELTVMVLGESSTGNADSYEFGE